eukprot:COSAG06_NODE_20569_length_790_cov_1.034732_1_plen_108_part_00
MRFLTAGRTLQENGTFLEFSLCLSRACLGKMMKKVDKKCRFLTATAIIAYVCIDDCVRHEATKRVRSHQRKKRRPVVAAARIPAAGRRATALHLAEQRRELCQRELP